MNEAELKLEKIKKSCEVTSKVTKILEIILIVGAILCLASSILCFCIRDQIDIGIGREVANGNVDIETEFMSADRIELGGLLSFTFDVDGLVKAGEYGKTVAIFCLVGALACALVAAVFIILKRIFDTLKQSETPFDEEVLKKMRRLFIVISVAVLIMSGVGQAALTALICWSVYTILDYGFTLQKQVDETL